MIFIKPPPNKTQFILRNIKYRPIGLAPGQ